MAANLPTYLLDAAAVTARNAEVTDTPFTDTESTDYNGNLGCNKAGSNAPGIGINSGFVDPKLTDWSVLDQAAAARSPQDSQHIGGSGLGAGDATNEPIRFKQGTDINDTASFSVADAAAVADAIYDTATGALNKTGATVAIGDRIWGPIPVT